MDELFLFGMIGIILLLVVLVISISIYVYTAICFKKIADKLKHPYSWLAWIPVVNFDLILQLGKIGRFRFILYGIYGLLYVVSMVLAVVSEFSLGFYDYELYTTIISVLLTISSIPLVVLFMNSLKRIMEHLNTVPEWSLLFYSIPVYITLFFQIIYTLSLLFPIEEMIITSLTLIYLLSVGLLFLAGIWFLVLIGILAFKD